MEGMSIVEERGGGVMWSEQLVRQRLGLGQRVVGTCSLEGASFQKTLGL